MKLVIEIEVIQGDGHGTSEPEDVAEGLVQELLEGQSFWVETDREDGEEREYKVKEARRILPGDTVVVA